MKTYYKSNLGIFQQHSEHFDDCDADYISYPNFEKAVAEILEREKAIQVEAKVKVQTADEELKQIAKRLSALAGMPYCWEDILDRLYHGYQLPFKFEK